MRHTVHKLFFAWQHEEEEKWLNEMSAQGFQLMSVGLCKYIFEEGECGEYIYRLELLEQIPSHYESIKYIRFLEETGVEHIGSWYKWIYVRKKVSDGGFEVYSDLQSKIKHFNRIKNLLGVSLIMNMPSIILNIINCINLNGMTIFMVLVCILSFLFVLTSIGFIQLSIKVNKLKKEEFLRE